MKTLVLAILVVSILMSGCVGVNGEPLEIPNNSDAYDTGFMHGCLTSIFFLTNPQNLPPYEQAIMACKRVYDEAKSQSVFNGSYAPEEVTPVVPEEEPPVVCDGNCI